MHETCTVYIKHHTKPVNLLPCARVRAPTRSKGESSWRNQSKQSLRGAIKAPISRHVSSKNRIQEYRAGTSGSLDTRKTGPSSTSTTYQSAISRFHSLAGEFPRKAMLCLKTTRLAPTPAVRPQPEQCSSLHSCTECAFAAHVCDDM